MARAGTAWALGALLALLTPTEALFSNWRLMLRQTGWPVATAEDWLRYNADARDQPEASFSVLDELASCRAYGEDAPGSFHPSPCQCQAGLGGRGAQASSLFVPPLTRARAGGFTLKQVWPKLPAANGATSNTWRQLSNPLDGGRVVGYSPIDVHFSGGGGANIVRTHQRTLSARGSPGRV